MSRTIRIEAASTNNLKEITCELPGGAIVGVTGPSGSGKSSLVFGTIWKEARRRLVAPLSADSKLLLEAPASVRSISGLSYPIAILPGRAGRSFLPCVATATGILPLLEELFVTRGVPRCIRCHSSLEEYSRTSIGSRLIELDAMTATVLIPAPRAERERFLGHGFTRAFQSGSLIELEQVIPEDDEDLLIFVDAVPVQSREFRARLFEALSIALRHGVQAQIVAERSDGECAVLFFSEKAACGRCGSIQAAPFPRFYEYFRRNACCPACLGAGVQAVFATERLIDPALPLLRGGVLPWRHSGAIPGAAELNELKRLVGLRASTSFNGLDDAQKELLLFGTRGLRCFSLYGLPSLERGQTLVEGGVCGALISLYRRSRERSVRKAIEGYLRFERCAGCAGARARPEAALRMVDGRSFVDVVTAPIAEVIRWLDSGERFGAAGTRLVDALGRIASFGLDYLSLDRAVRTLSGGELQRLEISRELGTPLQGVLYLLDEPSVGLHARDIARLVEHLHGLKAIGAGVIVVDHELQVMNGCDYVCEMGPAGA